MVTFTHKVIYTYYLCQVPSHLNVFKFKFGLKLMAFNASSLSLPTKHLYGVNKQQVVLGVYFYNGDMASSCTNVVFVYFGEAFHLDSGCRTRLSRVSSFDPFACSWPDLINRGRLGRALIWCAVTWVCLLPRHSSMTECSVMCRISQSHHCICRWLHWIKTST